MELIRHLMVAFSIGAGVFSLTRPKSSPPRTPSGGLSRRYDSVFRAEGKDVPIAYLRALAKSESDFNPNNTKGPAWGLMQVVEVVRESYNQRFGTTYSRQDLLTPTINVRIACELLSRIAKVYSTRHKQAFPKARWSDPRFAELVTFGWNAGYSEAAGVGYVMGVLEQRGVPPERITIDSVHEAATSLPKASRHLHNPAKVAWCKGVVRRYLVELAVDKRSKGAT